MKDKLIDKLTIAITILIVILGVYLRYTIITRINAKKEIKNNIKEIFKDYEIKDLKDIKIKIHSKTNYQTKISYNVELTSNTYDDQSIDTQSEIIKYIKNISFKGNKKKYKINKVTIYSNNNTYTLQTTFKKNDKIYGNITNNYTETANNIKDKANEYIDKAKDKYNEIKENIIK